MPNSVAGGGSGTINGVVYQLLWSLLRVVKLRVAGPVRAGTVPPESVTLVLEPHGGGGDLQLKRRGSLVVEQVKSRCGGGTWSLREVVEDVLPDLFLAVDADELDAAEFRFVTEGRMGAWRHVYDGLFRDLRNRGTSDDPLAYLDGSTNLTFTRHTNVETSFFPVPCTELSLFLKVAHVISQRPTIKELNLCETELHRRVRSLLCNFEFVGEQDIQTVQKSIDAILFAIIDKQDDIPIIRDHLAMELAKASTVGGVEIVPASFLSEHRVDAIPLTAWATHIENARNMVRRVTGRGRYDRLFDVRLDQLPGPTKHGSVLVLTGESGTGKTWMLNALAEHASGPLLPILIESEGTADASLKKCAEVFWNDIHDGDEVLPLSRVAKRLGKLTKEKRDTGLAVFIDGVRSYDEARRLVEQDWEALLSSLVLVCRPEHANSLQSAYPRRVQVYECRDFTWEELHDYLSRRLETGWAEIPIDVRETLRRPLLAGIYCDEFAEAGWKPQSEYELYQRVWNRLSTGQQSDWPLDAGCVEALARRAKDGAAYPWSQSQLLDAGIDNEGLVRLQRIGWIVVAGDRYRIFHDRLLQWAVAQSLCSDFHDGNLTVEALVEFVTEQVRSGERQQQIVLGYIPMDVLWILNQKGGRGKEVSVPLLESLENVDYQYSKILYNKLVPTLGECIADAVYERLALYDGNPWIAKYMADCLSVVGKDKIEQFARSLIESNDDNLQRRGVQLLHLVPCPPLLDQLWKIHIKWQSNPTNDDPSDGNRWLLYKETFDALKQSVRVTPDWLERAIDRADAAVDPVHDLAYLVANLTDYGLTWHLVKRKLFEKISPEKPRSLVANISLYRDKTELEWLRQWIGSEVDFVSSSALQALSRLNPDESVASLRKMDPMDLAASRHWSFAEVLERRSAETHLALLEWMKAEDNPWRIALVFQGRENDISTEQLDILLDTLTNTLKAKFSGDADPRGGIYHLLEFLSKLAAPKHLAVLRGRRGTMFESLLCDYVLRIGPQHGRSLTDLERKPAIAVLNIIGGDGLTTVTNEFLVVGDKYGKYEAIEWSARRPNESTFARLREIVQSDDGWSGSGRNASPVNQNEAMKVLAQHGHWESVVEGIKKWGMRVSPEVMICPDPVTEPWVDVLRQDVDSMPSPGNVLAIGAVGGGSDDCSRIHKILDQCEADSELAHACIIALGHLDDHSDEGVARVAMHLTIEKQRYPTTRMLLNAGTPRAWQALFEDLNGHFDFVTALNLINLSEHADDVAEIVLSHIPVYNSLDRHWLLKLFLTEIRPKEIRDRILNDRSVRELFHQASADAEGRFWNVGSKANAIECLAEFDSEAAYVAACHTLADVSANDRERYPSILTKIAPNRGIDWLVRHYSEEKSQLVRVAIGRTLEGKIPIQTVLDSIHAEEEDTRIAAVELAGWAALDYSVDVALTAALDDRSEDVIRAAITARQRRRDRQVADNLSRLIVSETDPVERAVYFDALIGFVDPGQDHGPLHHTVKRAFQAVSAFEAKDAFEKLKKRRKNLHDELKKAN